MITDIAIWTAPAPRARREIKGTDAARADVAGHSAEEEFTDADYVPVNLYPRPIGAVAIVSPVSEGRAPEVGRAHAAIQLYTSIFNCQYRPAAGLSVHV